MVTQMQEMTFQVQGVPRRFDVRQLVIAGWTGRDREAVEHHSAELAAIGVRRPRSIPCFYRLGTALLTSASDVDVVGTDSSGRSNSFWCLRWTECMSASDPTTPTARWRRTG